jgi:hypothetical protein
LAVVRANSNGLMLSALVGWLVLYMVLPSSVFMTSPRFLFSYAYVIACGLLSVYLACQGCIKIPISSPVIFTIIMALMLPGIKIYFAK